MKLLNLQGLLLPKQLRLTKLVSSVEHVVKLSLVSKGFEAGVKSVNKDISVDVQYAEDFNNPGKREELLQRHNTPQELTLHCCWWYRSWCLHEAKDLNEKKMKTKKLGYWCRPTKSTKVNTLSKDGKESNCITST